MDQQALYARADTLDQLADNETEDEVEYHRLRAEAAQCRAQADEIATIDG